MRKEIEDREPQRSRGPKMNVKTREMNACGDIMQVQDRCSRMVMGRGEHKLRYTSRSDIVHPTIQRVDEKQEFVRRKNPVE